MRASGAVRIIDFVELHARFSSELGDRYWLVFHKRNSVRTRSRCAKDSHDGRTARAASTTRSCSRPRLTGDPKLLPAPAGGIRPCGGGFTCAKLAARFVDGGADGDTARCVARRARARRVLLGFEPDPGYIHSSTGGIHRGGPTAEHELIRAALGGQMGTRLVAAGGARRASPAR